MINAREAANLSYKSKKPIDDKLKRYESLIKEAAEEGKEYIIIPEIPEMVVLDKLKDLGYNVRELNINNQGRTRIGWEYFEKLISSRDTERYRYKGKGVNLFLESLPTNKEFGRAEAEEIGKSLRFSTRSISNYLNQLADEGRITWISHGRYFKRNSS